MNVAKNKPSNHASTTTPRKPPVFASYREEPTPPGDWLAMHDEADAVHGLRSVHHHEVLQ